MRRFTSEGDRSPNSVAQQRCCLVFQGSHFWCQFWCPAAASAVAAAACLAEMSAHKEAGRRPASPAQTSDREQDEDDSHDQQALLHKSEDSSRTKQPSRMLDKLVTLTYCLTYLLVGPALILVNKRIMKVCSCMLSPELKTSTRDRAHTDSVWAGCVRVGARRLPALRCWARYLSPSIPRIW